MRAMCGVQLTDRKRSKKLMFMMGLMETMYQLAMVNSVRWYGRLLRREDGHILRRAFNRDFEVEGQRKKGRPMRTWKSRLRKKVQRLV